MDSFEDGERVETVAVTVTVGLGGSHSKTGREKLRRARRGEIGHRERDRMVHLASLLPGMQRVLMLAYLENNLTVAELAALHRVAPGRMRRRLTRLCETMSDPCFVAVAERADGLPAGLGALARAWWLEGRPLRELAKMRGESLHRIRQQLSAARILLESVHGERRSGNQTT